MVRQGSSFELPHCYMSVDVRAASFIWKKPEACGKMIHEYDREQTSGIHPINRNTILYGNTI